MKFNDNRGGQPVFDNFIFKTNFESISIYIKQRKFYNNLFFKGKGYI